MATTYKDIFDLNIKYLEYILTKSQFTHQYVRNIQESGGSIEVEVRLILSKVLPGRFKVAHGYIASAPNVNVAPTISPQVDIIIVDTLVPHSLFTIDDSRGLQIVPVECVAGIFEIKRTLNYSSLRSSASRMGAIEHLHNICSSVGITKSDSNTYLPGGFRVGNGIAGGHYSNPIIGIIGLDHTETILDDQHAHSLHTLVRNSALNTDIDIVTSFNGFLYAPVDSLPPHNLSVKNVRQQGAVVDYGFIKKSQAISRVYVFARSIGYILAYLQQTTGRMAPIQNYYFNSTL